MNITNNVNNYKKMIYIYYIKTIRNHDGVHFVG